MRPSNALAPLIVLLAAAAAHAQSTGEGDHAPLSVPPTRAIANRPILLGESQSGLSAGLLVNLSEGAVAEAWEMPLGYGYGILPDLEVGLDTTWRFKPWAVSTFISRARFYGRYQIVPGTAVTELAFYVPTVASGAFGVELLAPVRFDADVVQLYGEGRFLYQGVGLGGFEASDHFTLGAATSALFPLPVQAPPLGGLFAALDLGLTLQSFELLGDRQDVEVVLPVGAGFGLWLTPTTAARITFTFHDMAEDRPADQRSLVVSVFQAFPTGT